MTAIGLRFPMLNALLGKSPDLVNMHFDDRAGGNGRAFVSLMRGQYGQGRTRHICDMHKGVQAVGFPLNLLKMLVGGLVLVALSSQAAGATAILRETLRHCLAKRLVVVKGGHAFGGVIGAHRVATFDLFLDAGRGLHVLRRAAVLKKMISGNITEAWRVVHHCPPALCSGGQSPQEIFVIDVVEVLLPKVLRTLARNTSMGVHEGAGEIGLLFCVHGLLRFIVPPTCRALHDSKKFVTFGDLKIEHGPPSAQTDEDWFNLYAKFCRQPRMEELGPIERAPDRSSLQGVKMHVSEYNRKARIGASETARTCQSSMLVILRTCMALAADGVLKFIIHMAQISWDFASERVGFVRSRALRCAEECIYRELLVVAQGRLLQAVYWIALPPGGQHEAHAILAFKLISDFRGAMNQLPYIDYRR